MSRIVISKLREPFLNVAYENVMFSRLPAGAHRLFLWENDRTVVIGRNQNPWRDINLPVAAQLGYKILRRRSGGGAVVQGPGNANFSVLGPRATFDRGKHLELICAELKDRGLADLHVNSRFDIVNNQRRKISGSAFKIARTTAQHHATMLLNANLDELRQLLSRDEEECGLVSTSLGTESVRSPVANCNVSLQDYWDAWVAVFRREYGADIPVEYLDENTKFDDEMLEEAKGMQEWSWMFGQTPKFSHEIAGQTFEVEKGVITKAPNPELVGQNYRAPLPGCSEEILYAIDPWSSQFEY